MTSKRKILLIDDEQIMHDLAFAYLERAGYELISAYTGESGLRLLLAERPDGVLLDYMMPGINGEVVFTKIREDDRYRVVRDTPVIFLTARGGDDALKKRLIQKGVIAYLQKPFGLRELSNILDNVFIVDEIRRKNKELEREVQTTQEYLGQVIQNAPVGIVTTTHDGEIIEANKKLQSFFPIRSIKDLKRLNVFRSDVLRNSFLAEGVHNVTASGREWQQEFMKWQMPTGEQAVLTAKFVHLNPSEDGADGGIIGIVEDVTERERASYELHMLAQISLAIQEAVNLDEMVRLLLRSITSGTAFGFSRAMLLLLDSTEEAFVGKMGVESEGPLTGATPADALPAAAAREFDSRVRKIRIPLAPENRLVRNILDREPFLHLTSEHGPAQFFPGLGRNAFQDFIAVPLFAGDHLLGVIVVECFFGERKQYEARLHLLTLFAGHAANALERARAYEQLADEKQKLEAAYEKLREAHERLVQSERLAAIGEMAAHVAHEIRNPLVTIGGFARQMVKKTRQTSERNQAAEIIADEVLRLEKILANVLNFTKLPRPTLRKGDLNQVVAAVCEQLSDRLLENNIQLHVQLAPDLPEFCFDEAQIKQVLINLLLNSEQSINANGAIRIRSSQHGKDIRLTISDDGAGIKPEQLKMVFNPFYTTKEHGTGLGLAISQQIIHDHGGEIKVESEQGRGSSFCVRLPVDAAPLPADKRENTLEQLIL